MSLSFADIRREYLGESLSETASDPDPFVQFNHWFDQIRSLDTDATSMMLATATGDGRPSARVVLLKALDGRGFVFYTNYNSRKGQELTENPRASLLFYWRPLERQVRIEGTVERVSEADSDAYFASRPIESQWSVHASDQSAVVSSRDELDSRYEAARRQYGPAVPRPGYWGGYRVVPEMIEFWQGRPSRMHDRLRYRKVASGWIRERLAP
jgi:pyridoxamine 5'-phosphate oxidase